MSTLITAADLAKQFGIDEERLHRLRREKNWPCLKFSRTDVRFTPEHVEQIIAIQTVSKTKKTGQTRGSAARTRS